MTSRRTALLASMLVVAALFACKKQGGAGSECKADGDCGEGLLCESSACIPKAAAEKVRAAGGSTTVAGASGGSAGGSCAKAMACCKALARKSGNAETEKACDNYSKMSESDCSGPATQFESSAKLLGVVCGDATGQPESTAAAPAAGTAAPADTTVAADDGPIPAIPDGRSNPPQGSEWNQGKHVNTQGANAQAENCSMKVLREWLRIDCTGKVLGHEKQSDNWGTKGHDWFEHFVKGTSGNFVVRMRRNHALTVRICREKDRASLFMNWPGGSDRPKQIALGKGPQCEGVEFGGVKVDDKNALRCPPGQKAVKGPSGDSSCMTPCDPKQTLCGKGPMRCEPYGPDKVPVCQ